MKKSRADAGETGHPTANPRESWAFYPSLSAPASDTTAAA